MKKSIVAAFLLTSASFTLVQLPAKPLAQTQSAENQQQKAQPKPLVIPDKFTNLMVLPKDISKPELMNVMKQFSMTFQVRCSYCHAVSDDLTEGDLASDEKPTKLKARKLMADLYALKKAEAGEGKK